jgi:hypothetical protein
MCFAMLTFRIWFHGGGYLQRDPLRSFYSTLREQKPESEMAEIWCVNFIIPTV